MLRILQVNKLYSPWIGGIENVVQEIAEGLAASGEVKCEVLVCESQGGSRTEVINGVHVARVGSLGMALSMPVAPKFPARLERMATEFDIVHAHAPFPLAMFCNWKSLKRKGVRLVVHYHCDVVRPTQKAVMGALRYWNRRMLEAADRIIVTSEGLLNNSKVLSAYRDKCRVVPLSIDLSKVTTPSLEEIAAARRKYGLKEKERVVLFAGRLVYYKGIEYLIEAVQKLDAKLLIAGDGPLRETLEARVRTLGLGTKISFLGTVRDSELSLLYSLANVFVLPSIQSAEAFGVVQMEAMARGLPVINTKLPTGVPSVSIHGETGLTVPPANAPRLRDAIHIILSDEALRTRFSQNATRRVQRYSRPVVLRQIKSTYKEVIRQSAEIDV